MTNYLATWEPTDKQKDFLNDTSSIKAAMCGNITGKSSMIAFEAVCHLTGKYPDWWTGVRFDHHITAVVVGPTTLRVCDTLQKMIVDAMSVSDLHDYVKRPGIPGAIEEIRACHAASGISTLRFLSAEMCPTKFQVNNLDWVGIDEQVSSSIFTELVMRCLVKDGQISTAYTPLQEETICTRGGISLHNISMYDCPWIGEGKIKSITEAIGTKEFPPRVYGVHH